MTKNAFKLRERDVTKQVSDFLAWRGWRLIRLNVGKVEHRKGEWTAYGENGMPDFLALYYFSDSRPAASLALWVEMKQQGASLKPHQAEWHRNEIIRGAAVIVADEFEAFERFYWENFGWVHSAQGQQHLFSTAADQQ